MRRPAFAIASGSSTAKSVWQFFGTNSEANSLTVRAQRYLLDALLEAGVPATCLMPGTGCCSLMDTVELTRHATRAGVGGVLMRFCRNKRKPQSSACLMSARVRLLVPCARCSFSSTSRWK
jgi:hypothetical protein